jgi:hypothetical protein
VVGDEAPEDDGGIGADRSRTWRSSRAINLVVRQSLLPCGVGSFGVVRVLKKAFPPD